MGGFITDFVYDWRKHKVPPKQVAEADPLQFMLLEAAEQALADAGYDRKADGSGTCGVIVGTEVRRRLLATSSKWVCVCPKCNTPGAAAAAAQGMSS